MAINSEDRGALFVRQEELEDKINALMKELRVQGQILTSFGTALTNSASNITFTNAPMGLGAAPVGLLGKNAFEWSQLEKASSLTSLAQTIQSLRQAVEDLQQVKQLLLRR